jgi:hypothetical protein
MAAGVPAIGCPSAIVLPPPDPPSAEHSFDPRVNRDASHYFRPPGVCGSGSGAIAPHAGSGRDGSPGSAAPLHAATADARAVHNRRSRYGPDRNRCRSVPGSGSLAPRTEKAGHTAGHLARNRRCRHAPDNGVDARHHGCEDACAIVPLHGLWHGAEAKLAGDGSAPCLPANPGSSSASAANTPRSEFSRIAQRSPPLRARSPRGSSRASHPSASLRSGRSAARADPSMDRESDHTAAENCAFRPAFTHGHQPR